jgi:hypothetical protein
MGSSALPERVGMMALAGIESILHHLADAVATSAAS